MVQTKLEQEAIAKRKIDDQTNISKIFGVKNDQSSGYDSDNQYNEDKARKGGDETGSITDHLHKLDLTSGGSYTDKTARNTQTAYVIPDTNSYSAENIYSDADNCLIDTSLNVGQVVIY